MAKLPLSQSVLLPKLAQHVLNHGLGAASLRPLAKAAQTSDRMLIYHFGSKEQLVVALLDYLAEDYAKLLDATFQSEVATTRAECIARVLEITEEPEAQRYNTMWWEIVAGSARDLPGYRSAAARVMQRMLEWLEANMPVDDPDPAGGARYLLTMIEGALMLRAASQRDIADTGIAAMPTHP